MSAYQTARYNVEPSPTGDGYAVTNLRGKALRGPLPLAAACEVADLYQADDDAEAAEERLCARLDGQ